MGKRGKKATPAKVRFKNKFVVDKQSGCWEWTASKVKGGYGQFYIGPEQKDKTTAHRASYLLFKGEIPEGHDVDHICNNPGCVNPDHLQTLTRQENLYRSPYFGDGQKCPHGHLKTTENRYEYEYGGLSKSTCKICVINRAKAHQLKKKRQKKHAKRPAPAHTSCTFKAGTVEARDGVK